VPDGKATAGCPRCGADFTAMSARLYEMFGVLPNYNGSTYQSGMPEGRPRQWGWIDVRVYVSEGTHDPDGLDALLSAMDESTRAGVRVASLGDEIPIVAPASSITNETFAEWCRGEGIAPDDIGCVDWKAAFCAPADPAAGLPLPASDSNRTERLYIDYMYYSWSRYVHDAKIAHFRHVTEQLKKWLPKAGGCKLHAVELRHRLKGRADKLYRVYGHGLPVDPQLQGGWLHNTVVRGLAVVHAARHATDDDAGDRHAARRHDELY
jgi:hypothetical protein